MFGISLVCDFFESSEMFAISETSKKIEISQIFEISEIFTIFEIRAPARAGPGYMGGGAGPGYGRDGC